MIVTTTIAVYKNFYRYHAADILLNQIRSPQNSPSFTFEIIGVWFSFVVMDNLPSHKLASIEELIQSKGASIQHLSPYSPDLNPIEN